MSEPSKIRTKSYSDIGEQVHRIWQAAGGRNMTADGRARFERAVNAMGRYRGNIENTPEYRRNEEEINKILRSKPYRDLSDAERSRLNQLHDENMQRQYSTRRYKNNRR